MDISTQNATSLWTDNFSTTNVGQNMSAFFPNTAASQTYAWPVVAQWRSFEDQPKAEESQPFLFGNADTIEKDDLSCTFPPHDYQHVEEKLLFGRLDRLILYCRSCGDIIIKSLETKPDDSRG